MPSGTILFDVRQIQDKNGWWHCVGRVQFRSTHALRCAIAILIGSRFVGPLFAGLGVRRREPSIDLI